MGSRTCYLFFREEDGGSGQTRRPVRENSAETPTSAVLSWFGSLSFTDAICWGFGITEGDLNDIYWTYARREIQQKLQLKIGELTSTIMSHHNSMALLLNAALGSGKPKPPTVHDPNVKNLAEGHGSVEDAVRAINQAMTI